MHFYEDQRDCASLLPSSLRLRFCRLLFRLRAVVAVRMLVYELTDRRRGIAGLSLTGVRLPGSAQKQRKTFITAKYCTYKLIKWNVKWEATELTAFVLI